MLIHNSDVHICGHNWNTITVKLLLDTFHLSSLESILCETGELSRYLTLMKVRFMPL
jgi:hypothetical protein